MYTNLQLKQHLLETNLFLDNDYLEKYINIIVSNYNTDCNYNTQIHHILQKSYFNHLNLPIDNTANNLVVLLYRDHVLAHYYLYKCTIS